MANICGSTVISPSWRFQYVHIGRSGTTSPDGVRTSIVAGSSSSDQKRFAHGPGAITSCSPTWTRPRLVSSALAVPSASSSIARTSTPLTISTPSSAHLPASPSTDSRLKAKPPWCSCRSAVTPCARQSGKISRMYAPTSASPETNVER